MDGERWGIDTQSVQTEFKHTVYLVHLLSIYQTHWLIHPHSAHSFSFQFATVYTNPNNNEVTL